MPVWNQLITAAIVGFVVISALWGGKGIAHAADKISDITGIDIGSPALRSFTATPDGNGNMTFQLSLGGGKSDVELLIYQRYEESPEKELDVPDLKEDAVYKLIASGTGAKLVDVMQNGVVKQTCPKEGQSKGCQTEKKYELGGYRFVAVLKKKGKVVDGRGTVTGFYDENYVEMLHKPVFGCEDPYFQDCNVIECKKELINKDLLLASGSAFQLELRGQSGILRKISDEFRNEKGFGPSNDCGKAGDAWGNVVSNDEGGKALHFVLKGCSDKDIDDLNIKVVRARLLESVKNANGVTSEDEYSKSLAQLDRSKEQSVEMTLSCTMPLSLLGVPTPKGAKGALKSLGWQLVSLDGKTDIWEGRINAELDRVLNSKLRPGIFDAVADTNNDGQLALGWKMPIGKDALTQYQLKLFHSSAALGVKLTDVKKLADAKKIQLAEIALPQQPAKGEVFFKYPAAMGLTSAQMGAYWFELTAFDSQGESSKAESHKGVYDINYVELYRDVKDASDACGSGCDVAGKKESALGNDEIWQYTRTAFDKLKKDFQGICLLEPKKKRQERISGCLPREVDLLYRDAVTAYVADLLSKTPEAIQPGKTAADLLKFDCWKETWMDSYQKQYLDTGIKAVCYAKSDLKKSLDGFNWDYTGG